MDEPPKEPPSLELDDRRPPRREAPAPHAFTPPRRAPQLPTGMPPPPSPSSVRWIVRGILLAAFLALFFVPKLLWDRSREAEAAPDESANARPDTAAGGDLESKTADCLRMADTEAEAAKARIDATDPTARMQAEIVIDDRRRLARTSCKQHETECKRDPKSLPCIMNAK